MPDTQETKPSDMKIREEFRQMFVGDLLGPAEGEHEKVYEPNVRNRYLVGVLAPRHPLEEGLFAAGKEDEGEEDVPVIPDELSEGGADSIDDGKTDKDVPVAYARFPSSFGITFCVAGDALAIRVEAEWGQYLKEEEEDKDGKPVRFWKRYPRGGTLDIKLKTGEIKRQSSDPEIPDVYVQGRIRKRDDFFIVSLFLVNGQDEKRPKDQYYIFQPRLAVTGKDGSAVFIKKQQLAPSGHGDPAVRMETERLEMLYRHHVEFGVGHGVSIHAEVSPETPDRAVMLSTEVMPAFDVPKTTPPTDADGASSPAFARLQGVTLDMKDLAEGDRAAVQKMLTPLIDAYSVWIDSEEKRIGDPSQRLGEFTDAAAASLADCRKNLERMKRGLDLLRKDDQAFEAFRFMNRAMWLQRTHTLFSEEVRRGGKPDFDGDIDKPENRTWYPFQMAFILLAVPGATLLDHMDRSESAEAVADLLFFPTGGGKTEAYLGLAAYTMGLRRLQGVVAGRPGENGVAVLMRYTLRVLTIQQFQRATALICSCEDIRRTCIKNDDKRWGETPFRLGLWVGMRITPNRTDDAAEAIRQLRTSHGGGSTAGYGSPYQLTHCPWCGSRINPGKHLETRPYKQGTCRTLTFCGDKLGSCPFSKRGAPNEGLPAVVVDEEIYRRVPSMIISTADKFAQMPWRGEIQMLFGQVNGYCERHGFRSPDVEDADSHPKTPNGLSAVKSVVQTPLRPPDLIIQDELHLISGPLGSLMGLYETAIDRLCTWDVDGRRVRPKVIASTATIRSADVQVHKLFLRRVNIFPPHGLDARDNFFTLQREPSDEHPGRLYLGVCASGRRLKAALIRVYVALLCSAQALYDKYGETADPWMTLVGYFNSLRELGGMRRLADDDVRNKVQNMERRGMKKRTFTTKFLAELTSRIRAEDIPLILDRLETPFEKDRETPQSPIDVLLATNMISVGVDIKRLGLMVVAGQPKSTAEYIQATSRVGRTKPGLVVTLFNWARPRDLSHYETFEHYHATFYKHVEALSVTPFAPGALGRGLAALLVSLVRMSGTEFNRNEDAGKFDPSNPCVHEAIKVIVSRAEAVGDGTEVGEFVRKELKAMIDHWQATAQDKTGGRTLTYSEKRGSGGPERGTTVSLLDHAGLAPRHRFTCLDSLRDVEPTVKLIMEDWGLDEMVYEVEESGPDDEKEETQV